MKQPFVSIIVPIYNVENYINDCLNSLINQTLKNIEIILVDDGSSDSSGKICDNYAKKDKRIVVIHQKNKKQGGARNTGIEIARGKYITFVDSDDWVKNDFAEKLYNKAIQTNADIVICDYQRTKNKNVKLGKSKIEAELLLDEPFDLKKLVNQPSRRMSFFFVVCWNKLFKKNIAKKYLYFPENLSFEDSAPVLRTLVMAKKIAVVDEKLYFYRISNSFSTTHSKDIRKFDLFKVQDIIINDLKNFDFGNFKSLSITFMIKDLFKNFRTIEPSLRLNFYHEMKNTFKRLQQYNYLKLADRKYRLKSWFVINTNYPISCLISKI